jgi:eukaryotic-like serine/threonine-protein kinase
MTSCASTNTIAALLAGAADRAAAERLELHLDECAACRCLVADLGRGLSAIGGHAGATAAHALPQPGESIGRYEIERVLGVGGMGVVYAARDTTLERCIAIKLLRPDLVEGPSLLAEAQAMARLQHPNIVAVHDAGIAAGQLYVCMEYVAGSTLRAWRNDAPRDWRSIARVYVAAGEGLAYVHRAGLVHLDFKPDNVLVDRDGRVRVTDFGLAHMVGARPRAIVGTPAYMAPEQRSGQPSDARCDQYAFCVSLREALDDTAAPSWLLRVIERGASAHPDDRFATMDELLAAIAAGFTPRRRRAAALALVAAASLVALVGSWSAAPVELVTRIVELPIVRSVIEYREVAGRADSTPSSAVLARSESRDVVAESHGVVAPAAARGFAPARRAPVLHVEPVSPSTLAAAFAAGDDDATPPPAIGAGYCDDGSAMACGWWPPSCPTGTLLAIQQGCWTCAEVQTCGPLGFPRNCNDGSQLRCGQPPPECTGRRVAAVRNGCWSCEDPFTCWARVTMPKLPPPRKPPPPNGSNTGSNGGSNAGASCGNGFCEAGETHAACASDCCETDANGSCLASCGNGFCEGGEDHSSCAADCCEQAGSGGCAPVCGNGFCEEGETSSSCPSEC